jgi:hypothetical protein
MLIKVKDNLINVDGIKRIFKDSFDYPVKYTIGFYYNNDDIFKIEFNNEEDRDWEFERLSFILVR